MANPASIADIESRWRPLSDQELINAQAFLDDAYSLLLDRRPLLEEHVAAGTVKLATVTRVVATMALRVLKNPDGYEQESLDDWSGRRNRLISDGVLRVTSEELADVTPGRRRNRSIRLVTYGDA